MDGLRIGQVARASGVSVRAIRHYDGLGLLSSLRGDNRYRVFQTADVERVWLIQLLLSVGFSLAEIGRYAPCFQQPGAAFSAPRAELEAMYERKLADIEARLAVLGRLRDTLARHLGHVRAQGGTTGLPPH